MANDHISWRTPEGEEPRFQIERGYWPGISAQRVTIHQPQEFGTSVQSDSHMLVLHNIVRTDGDTKIDGFGRSARHDLRDTLTFLPRGARIEAWTKVSQRLSSSLVVFLDPDLDESGELHTNDLPPCLFFRDTLLKQSIEKINAVIGTSQKHEQVYVEHLAFVLLCELSEALWGKQESLIFKGGLTPQQSRLVCDYVMGNLSWDISLSEMAELVKLSKFHFIRAFKKTTGLAPYQFVLSRRVERAQELLAQPRLSVAAVAKSVGFHNTLQLDRAFHRLMGMTPWSYRNQVAGNRSKFIRQEPANVSNLTAHPKSLGSSRDCCETPQHDADHGETDECSEGAGTIWSCKPGGDCG